MKIPLPKKRIIPNPKEAYSEFCCSACLDNLSLEAIKAKKCQWCGASTDKSGNQEPNSMIDRWNRWARDHGGARPEQVERPKVEAESPRDPWVWTICTNPKLEPIGKWEGKKHR